MLTYQHLGATPEIPSVAECKRDLGVNDAVCQELINQAIATGIPDGYWILARMALVGVASKKCAATLQSFGVPLIAGLPACTWAANKLWRAGEIYFSWGGPTYTSLAAGKENLYWRRCDGASKLQPGEHLVRRNGRDECHLNVAIGNFGNRMRFVYIPCEYLHALGMTGACMDSDGIRRATGTRDRLWSGFYKERLSEWPSQFDPAEGGQPWIPPAVNTQVVNTALKVLIPGYKIASTAQTPALPTGSIATLDAGSGLYRVAVPPGTLGADPYVELPVQYASAPAGAAIVTESEFETAIGNQPFYKRGLFWGIALGAVAAAVGGGYAVSRLRRSR